MIRATANANGALFTLNASVSGPVVHLDNWAFIELDLLFSVTNAAELSGSQGRSAEAVRSLLDEIGPRWFPAKHDATEAIKCKLAGRNPDAACIDEHFFKSYVADRMRPYVPGCGKVINLSSDFFHLGPLLDRVGPQRESIYRSSAEFDELLKHKMNTARALSKQDPTLLDQKFPRVPFNPRMRACFVHFNLLRIMAVDAGSLKKGDGMDFCHAVMGCAFASFATLDRQWKRRVDSLPKPNQLARIYGPSELDQMVTDMEAGLAHRAA